VSDIASSGPVRFGAAALTIALAPGETAWLRRSSLIYADGRFKLTTHRIAQRRFSVIGTFSGEARWANRYVAEDRPVSLIAARDFEGQTVSLDIAPDAPVYFLPDLYLGHQGDLTFNTERVAKKEFWTLTRASGAGTVHIKLHGQPTARALHAGGSIVDANYVAAITGPFTAYGKVFKAGEVIRSGELENVRLAGSGEVIFQSANPEEASGSSGGPIGGLIRGLLPF
jgi:uncharacterized protein (AIM24 family)